ncbi:unnamed protein product [Adineta steineri]|uniref:DOMON domain-containing protein n=2 Tax=Adineta steineri TaxID=433720 RepID=A0A814VZI5_9BILA|nr:unnamed protein product [Adineta steineri]CAF1188304.1 unnamed protein product [Adineta steineri]CAF1198022.1 unnamed protein product [Adineta steineri]CAF1463837.1 unnamed protein product [Adineta steineri]CAF3599805.1 unnamed protein product [Adineta steineri]
MHHYLLSIIFILILINNIHSQIAFESLCTPEVEVPGLPSINGNDEFEIDLYETKFLPDDTVLLAIKQKRQNYGIGEFVLRAFDADNNVVGRFDDRQTGKISLKHHTCPNGASVIYVDKIEGHSYRQIPLAWRALSLDPNLDEITFRADIVSNKQIYRVKSAPLKKRVASGLIPSNYQSVNIDFCGESQGCLVVPQYCNNNSSCEYALSWQVIDENTARFHIVARAHGFVGVGFSNDEKRGDDQVVLCTRDAKNHVYVRNMFVGVQTPQNILRDRPLYGLQDTDGYSNGSHIVCKFDRKLSPHTPEVLENDGKNPDGVDNNKFVNLKEPHYMYPIYTNEDLLTSQGMRIPAQDIPIVNNHPINFERGIWPKSHPRDGAFLAKLHAILNIIAWILLASAGVMVARYFDLIWPEYERRVVVDSNGVVTGEKLQRRRRFSFFNVFQPIMVTVAILTWLAFFAILLELNWKWTYGTHHMWHSILGVIVLVCAFLAPLIGILRPVPRTKRFCCWYWIHWLVVSLAHCLAVPVIFLGMDNRRLDLWTWCSWLLFGWCIFHFIVQLIFEIHACCCGRQDYERFEDADYYSEKHPDHRARRERVPGEAWKPALLSIYVFITVIVVIILILAVIFYQGY